MEWNSHLTQFTKLRGKAARTAFVVVFIFFLLPSCSVSYSFQGGKLNYDLLKTITIHDFPNRTSSDYPLLSQVFGQELRNRFIEQTRLLPVSSNGDIEIEGEITGYSIQNTAVKEDAYGSQTRLTITVRLKYTNNKEANSDVDQTFSANREFSSDQFLDESAKEGYIKLIIADLIDSIYNATVANW
jgi:hypothetical protein